MEIPYVNYIVRLDGSREVVEPLKPALRWKDGKLQRAVSVNYCLPGGPIGWHVKTETEWEDIPGA